MRLGKPAFQLKGGFSFAAQAAWRQNALDMLRPSLLWFVFAFPLVAVACSGSTDESTAPKSETVDATVLSLDLPVPDVAAAPAPAPAAVPPSSADAAPSTVSKEDGRLLLRTWHRSGAAARMQLLTGTTPAHASLRAFVAGQEGGGPAYADLLRTEQTPPGLGPVFSKLAKAWSEQGVHELVSILNLSQVKSAAWLAWAEFAVTELLAGQQWSEAGALLGDILRAEVQVGYDRERILELSPLVAGLAKRASAYVPYREYKVQSGDSLWKIKRDLRKEKILVNDGWLIEFNRKRKPSLRAGETLKIPLGTLQVEVWRQLRVLALFIDGVPIRLLAASMGEPGAETPLGEFTLKDCLVEPVYWPQDGRGAIPFGNPENPLGARWLGFAEDPSYGIHGTVDDKTIGSFESQGCVRLRNGDVTDLFELIGPGVGVKIQP